MSQVATTLKGETEGVWRVTTASGSVYEIDLDNKLVVRQPGEGASLLRKDDYVTPLLEVVMVEVGTMLELMIQLRDDEVSTYRRGTAVESIERIVP